MGDRSQWEWKSTNNNEDDEPQLDLFKRGNDLKTNNDTITCLNSLLSNDILIKIFSFLPVATVIRVRLVCKRWHEALCSRLIKMPPQKPWYIMLTSINNIATYSYDSTFKTWYTFYLFSLYKRYMFVSSSCGLISFIDYEHNQIFVCNPITRERKRIPRPQSGIFSNYTALALVVDRFSCDYTVAVVESKLVSRDIFLWGISIMIFESKSRLWKALMDESLIGWRGGNESVICRGILYFIVHSCSWNKEPPLRLIIYDLHSNSSSNSLMQRMIVVPCPLMYCRLMNLGERLVLVGGIRKRKNTNLLKRITILELRGEEWEEIGSIKLKFFQDLWLCDDGFSSSGTGDLIFIHSNCSPQLVIFDIIKSEWKRATCYPITDTYPLQRFIGFCFEPRLDITP